MALSPLLSPGALERLLDQAETIVRGGETALPTFHLDTGDGPQRMVIAAEPADMEAAFERARKVLIFKRAQSFFMTGHTNEPEGLYAVFLAPGGGAGLFRPITRAQSIGFGPDQPLGPESLAPLMALRPQEGETLDPATTAKIRSLVSLHAQLEPGTPMVIRGR